MSFLQDEFTAVQQAISSGAFDPQGMNYTSFAGSPLQHPYAAPGVGGKTSGPSFASPTSPMPGDATAGSGSASPVASTAGAVASGIQGALGITPGSNFFSRGVVIVLGFIFVAAGLRMFGVLR